jgi:hypothetical protein
MLVPREDMIDQSQPLLRDAHPTALQVFDKPIAGGGRDRYVSQ